MDERPPTAGWAVLSSSAAPVLLIGGWTWAAARQSGGFDPVADTISALAAPYADDPWLMTSALAGVGVAHLVTALGLRDAAGAGRCVLGVGGLATVLVAAFPLPADHGSSAVHAVVAGTAFAALGAWPACSAARRPGGPPSPWAVRRPVAWSAAAGLLGLVGWFVAELAGGSRVGLAERVAAGAQAVWPLIAVLSTRRAARRGRAR